jgi:hypothetical protein
MIDRRTAGIIKATGNLPTAPAADRTAPAAPGAPYLIATGDFDVAIGFAASASADVAYYVARADGANQSCGQSSGNEPRIALTGLAPGAHTAEVYAVDTAGNFSAASPAGYFDIALVAANNRIACVGDSYDERLGSLTSTETQAYAVWHQIAAQMGHKLDFVYIDGQSGTGALQSPKYAGRIDAALATDAHFVALRASVNDFHNGANTLSAIIAEYSALFDRINAAGKGVITNTVPNTTLMDTAAKNQNRVAFNVWVQAQFAAGRWWGAVLNQHYLSTNGAPNTTLYPDGVHPVLPASILLGASGARELDALIIAPGWIERAQGASSLVDASYYAKNPFNLGTNGTKFARVTGQVPTGKSVSAPTDPGTVVAAIIPRNDAPGNWCQLTVTSTALGQLIGMGNDPSQRTLAAGGVQIGDVVQYGVEFEFPDDTNPDTTGYPVVMIECRDAANAAVPAGTVTGWKNNSIHPAPRYLGGKRMTVVTPQLTVPATTTYFVLTARFYNSGKAGESFGEFTGRIGREAFVNHSRPVSP